MINNMAEVIEVNSIEDEIYKENILDHYRNPRNFGEIRNCTVKNLKYNPSCGDKIQVSIIFNGEIIKDIKFSGTGCAISVASASMLSEKLIGKSLSEAKNIGDEEVLDMIGVPLGVVRRKCGLLALNAFKGCLSKMEKQNERLNN